MVRDCIVDHLESNGLLSPFQHGFRKGYSCATQLLECLEDWSTAIDEGKNVDVVYLDFKAAFDKVPHERLLQKIWNFGIQGKIHDWLRDFLNSRRQQVVIQGETSSWAPVGSGVPQGSVLGPIMFLMFINDIPEAMSCVTRLFADDTKLYSIVGNEDDKQRLQDDIFEANKWANTWQMLFNVKKCKFMQIGNRPEDTQYFMKDQNNEINEIQEVQAEKDLGITFDPKLTFSTHVNNKVKLANRNIGIIMKSFCYMSKEMFLTLYKSLVRPHLEYISSIW